MFSPKPLYFLQILLIFAQAQEELTQIPTGTDIYQLFFSLADSSITFEVTVETKGWIGFGFTNVSGMTSSDIFIGGINEDSTMYSGDYSSLGVGMPGLDELQDWDLLEASETETTTFLRFKRTLETNDEKDINITDGFMKLILAVGSSDTLSNHGRENRFSLEFNLITGESPPTTATPPTTITTTDSSGISSSTTPPITNTIPLETDLLTVSYLIIDETITFTAISKTKGYIGFGLSNRTTMYDSDIIVLGFNDTDGQVYYGDYVSNSVETPKRDEHEDWVLISATQTEDGTTAIFSRLLNTNDPQDVPIENKNQVIIWALGASDDLQYHPNRGQITFNLINFPDEDHSTSTTPEPKPGDVPMGTDLVSMSYTINQDTITFSVVAQTTGYVGIGFTNFGGMEKADLFIATVSPNGVAYANDYHSESAGMPTKDSDSNYILVSANQTETETSLVFSRLLDTEDEQDVAIVDRDIFIIWALGSSDDILYHESNRGQTSYNLIAGQESVTFPPLPPLPIEIPLNSDRINITYSITEEIITFQVIGKTKGFIGLGFSNKSGMEESDMFIGGVFNDGTVYFTDANSNTTETPKNDTSQDWDLIEGTEAGDFTRLVFSRKLVTGDLEDIQIEDKKMTIIWSMGYLDFITYHGERDRGQIEFNFKSSCSKLAGQLVLIFFSLFLLK